MQFASLFGGPLDGDTVAVQDDDEIVVRVLGQGPDRTVLHGFYLKPAPAYPDARWHWAGWSPANSPE